LRAAPDGTARTSDFKLSPRLFFWKITSTGREHNGFEDSGFDGSGESGSFEDLSDPSGKFKKTGNGFSPFSSAF